MSAPEHPEIRSLANPIVKHLVRLRDNRTRRRLDRVIVDGWRETARAIDGGLDLCGLYLPTGHEDSGVAEPVLSQAQQRGLLKWVSPAVMQRISYGQSHRGVVAEFVAPDKPLSGLQLAPCPLILVLDHIEKPGNIGAVFRCADAAGVDAVIVTDADSDLFNPNAVRSSLGAVFVVPAAVASMADTQAFLTEKKIRPLAARVESSQSLWETDLTGPLAIILGSEAKGLGDRWQNLAGQPIAGVRIPLAGRIDSLNISVSAAVIAFEAIRVRTGCSDG